MIGQCIAARKDAAYGARPALRAIDDLVAEPLGQKLLEIGANSPRAYRAEVKDGEIIFIPQNTVQKDTNAARNTIKAPPEEEPA